MAIATPVPGFNSAVIVGQICEICCELDYRIVYYTHEAELKPDACDGNSHPGTRIQLGHEGVADYH